MVALCHGNCIEDIIMASHIYIYIYIYIYIKINNALFFLIAHMSLEQCITDDDIWYFLELLVSNALKNLQVWGDIRWNTFHVNDVIANMKGFVERKLEIELIILLVGEAVTSVLLNMVRNQKTSKSSIKYKVTLISFNIIRVRIWHL